MIHSYDGQSEDDYIDEITSRQTHLFFNAVDRVSLIYDLKCKLCLNQLIHPFVMDPAGILMLRSVRIVLKIIGIRPESMKFKKEKFDSDNLVKSLTEYPRRCPAISTALKGSKFIHETGPIGDYLRNQWFIYCKHSYRDDPS